MAIAICRVLQHSNLIACAPIHTHTHTHLPACNSHSHFNHSLIFYLCDICFIRTRNFSIYLSLFHLNLSFLRHFIVMVYARRCLGYLCSYFPAYACCVCVFFFFKIFKIYDSRYLYIFYFLPKFLFSLLLLAVVITGEKNSSLFLFFYALFSLSICILATTHKQTNKKTRGIIYIFRLLSGIKNMRKQSI